MKICFLCVECSSDFSDNRGLFPGRVGSLLASQHQVLLLALYVRATTLYHIRIFHPGITRLSLTFILAPFLPVSHLVSACIGLGNLCGCKLLGFYYILGPEVYISQGLRIKF